MDEDKPELTEIVKSDTDHVDLVEGPANGIPLLLAKSDDAEANTELAKAMIIPADGNLGVGDSTVPGTDPGVDGGGGGGRITDPEDGAMAYDRNDLDPEDVVGAPMNGSPDVSYAGIDAKYGGGADLGAVKKAQDDLSALIAHDLPANYVSDAYTSLCTAKYGDDLAKMADQGAAMADKSYPIADAQDVLNAVAVADRTGADKAKRAYIIARAKALGDSVPDAWMGKGTQKIDRSKRSTDKLRPIVPQAGVLQDDGGDKDDNMSDGDGVSATAASSGSGTFPGKGLKKSEAQDAAITAMRNAIASIEETGSVEKAGKRLSATSDGAIRAALNTLQALLDGPAGKEHDMAGTKAPKEAAAMNDKETAEPADPDKANEGNTQDASTAAASVKKAADKSKKAKKGRLAKSLGTIFEPMLKAQLVAAVEPLQKALGEAEARLKVIENQPQVGGPFVNGVDQMRGQDYLLVRKGDTQPQQISDQAGLAKALEGLDPVTRDRVGREIAMQMHPALHQG